MSKNDTVDLVSSDEEDEERRERSPNRTVELSTSSSSSEEGPDEVSDEEEDEKFVTGISSPGKITTPVPESGPVQASSYVTSTPAAPTMRFSPNEEVFEGAGESEAPEEDILDELTEKHQRGVASRILDSTTDSTIVEKGDLDETLESKTTLRNANESINDPSNGNNKRKRMTEDPIISEKTSEVSQNASFFQNESLLNASTKPNFDSSDLKDRNSELSSFMSSNREDDELNETNENLSRAMANPNKRIRKSEVDAFLLPKTCTVLRTDTAIVYLVGTAHFSRESQEDVRRTITVVQPDVIMLELCKARTNVFQMDEETILKEVQSMGMRQVIDIIKRDGAVRGTLALLLQNLSAYLTKQLGMAPGGEFRTAWREAKKIPGCLIHLGDRPIGVTLQRAIGALSLWQKIHLGIHLLCTNESFTKEDVEKCKEKDLLESMLEEMTGEFPALTKVFIDERDLFLAHSLKIAGSHSLLQHRRLNTISPHSDPPLITGDDPAVVVGVVGLGHIDGILKVWDKVTPEDVARVMKIPIPSASEIVARKIFKFGFYSLVAYGAYRLLRGPISKIVKN
ncbi:traB domain-containing protein [Lepeophtheirus salmonis]|uniref:traB domain-containing protein n=1 Tax=Lepeophtheirus salmonis TaxID=72036 RepID=UPI001AEB7153|nr:traB domain-containing protein-like [Lepeophtheirus salmonis]